VFKQAYLEFYVLNKVDFPDLPGATRLVKYQPMNTKRWKPIDRETRPKQYGAHENDQHDERFLCVLVVNIETELELP